jgi:hypothetical protein
MIQRLYVRIAKRHNYHNGTNIKVDASPTHNPRALEVSGRPLRTIHFAIDLDLPHNIFDDPAMPVVQLKVDGGGAYAISPDVSQVSISPPEDEPEEGE